MHNSTMVARCGLAAFLVAALSQIAGAQDDPFAPPTLIGKFGKRANDIEVTATLTAETLKPGQEAVLAITVRLPAEHYIYATTEKSSSRATIQVKEAIGLTAIDPAFVPDRAPLRDVEPGLNKTEKTVEKFVEHVTWFRRYRINDDADPLAVEIGGDLAGQYCGDGACMKINPPRKWHAEAKSGVPIVRPPKDFTVAGIDSPAGQLPDGGPDAAPMGATETLPLTKTERPMGLGKPGPVDLTFHLSPAGAAAGAVVTLSVKMQIEEGWHAYSMTMSEGQSAVPAAWALRPFGLTDAGSPLRADPLPEKKDLKVGATTYHHEVHHGEVTWSKDFVVTAEGAKAGYGLWGQIEYQTCTDANCLPRKKVAFALGTVPEGALALAEKLPIPRNAAPAPGAEAKAEKLEFGASDLPGTDQGLLPFLLAAAAAGFAALLTPCVFPMVPITVSFFLKQSETKHHRPLPMATLYCLGIMGTFTILGLVMAALFGATSVNELANNPWLNLVIAGVMVFFAFNLLGMFEIRVPYWLLSWTAGHEGKGGVVGVLFMALTFTLVSFTCTFAFCGLLLAWAAKGQFYWPVLGMLAFSAAFSSPFFFLALFPSFLQKLPKTGGWMNTVKVTMGMIELGAAIKFFSNADLAWNPEPVLFDFTFTVLGWLVISVMTGLYLLGVFRLPHDTPSQSVSVFRFAAAMTFLMLGGFLAAGLFAPHEPGGKLWASIKSMAPARIKAGADELGPYVIHDELKYALDYERAFQMAKAEGKPLFFDITGVNCPNCRKMEILMARPASHSRLEKFIRAQIYTDNVPGVADSAEAERLLEQNRKYQAHDFGDASLPSYAIVTPDGEFLVTLKGYKDDEQRFTEFLDEGLRRWSAKAGGRAQAGRGVPAADVAGAPVTTATAPRSRR